MKWKPSAASEPLERAAELVDDMPDPVAAALQSTITVRAFRSLPERWQTILWYTEVEGMQPAEAAPHLGLTANGAAALAYRAREGLKAAWLQAHVSDVRVPDECRWASARMGERSRGALSARQQRRFDEHVADCARCSILVEEVDELSGRLASLVLPLVLGGTAGSALLAQLLNEGGGAPSHTQASRDRHDSSRWSQAAVATGVAVVSVVAVAALAFASMPGGGVTEQTTEPETPSATSPLPTRPADEVEPPRVDEARVNEGDDSSVTEPRAPTTPTRPQTPPVEPAPAPSTPVVAEPASESLVATSSVAMSGTGDAGNRIIVRAAAVSGGPSSLVGATTVAGSGTWTLSTDPLPDGTTSLDVTQLSREGRVSSTVSIIVHVDTIALPPVVDSLETTGLRLLPTISGDAEPYAAVVLLSPTDAVLAETVSDEDGRWSLALPDPGDDVTVVRVEQTDLAGNRSAPTELGPFTFERPALLDPADGADLVAAPGGTVVSVSIGGSSGDTIEVLINGVPTGNIHTLGADPIVRTTPPLAPGTHSIGVRYIDVPTGRVGSVHTVVFTIS